MCKFGWEICAIWGGSPSGGGDRTGPVFQTEAGAAHAMGVTERRSSHGNAPATGSWKETRYCPSGSLPQGAGQPPPRGAGIDRKVVISGGGTVLAGRRVPLAVRQDRQPHAEKLVPRRAAPCAGLQRGVPPGWKIPCRAVLSGPPAAIRRPDKTTASHPASGTPPAGRPAGQNGSPGARGADRRRKERRGGRPLTG